MHLTQDFRHLELLSFVSKVSLSCRVHLCTPTSSRISWGPPTFSKLDQVDFLHPPLRTSPHRSLKSEVKTCYFRLKVRIPHLPVVTSPILSVSCNGSYIKSFTKNRWNTLYLIHTRSEFSQSLWSSLQEWTSTVFPLPVFFVLSPIFLPSFKRLFLVLTKENKDYTN